MSTLTVWKFDSPTGAEDAAAMMSDAVMDKVQDAFEGVHAELISTNLSDAEEAKLRDIFLDD